MRQTTYSTARTGEATGVREARAVTEKTENPEALPEMVATSRFGWAATPQDFLWRRTRRLDIQAPGGWEETEVLEARVVAVGVGRHTAEEVMPVRRGRMANEAAMVLRDR